MISDILKIEFQGSSQQLQTELETINKKTKALRTELKELEKTKGIDSKEWKDARLELENAKKAAANLAKEMKTMDLSKMTLGQLENHAKQLAKELRNSDKNTKEFVANAKRLGEVEKEIKKAKDSIVQLKTAGEDLAKPTIWQKITNGVTSVGGAFKEIVALQIIGYLIDAGKAVFGVAEKFEKYQAVLKNALGSEKLAKQSMEAIKLLAKNTTFTVDELTEGYVKLVNRGMRPTEKQMLGMADLAASQGKSFDQLVEAALDAQTGEFERLKEFGIKASKEGDNVKFSFKGMNLEVKNTPEAIQGAIDKFGVMKGVAGANAEQMKTLGGMWSNVQDTITNTTAAIGEKLRPVFLFLLDLFAKSVGYIAKVVDASDPLVEVFSDIFDAVGDVINVISDLIKDIIPQTSNGGAIITKVMQGVALAFRYVMLPIQLAAATLRIFYDAMSGVVNGGKALIKVLSGDFKGAAADFEKSKTSFSNVKTHAVDSFDKIKKGFTNAFVDHPKKETPAAVLAAGTMENKRQGAITDEQKKAQAKQESAAKKHLEEIQKANEEALKKLSRLHDDSYLEFIKRTQGEVAAEKVKVQQLLDEELLEINNSKANEELKGKLRKAALEKYLEQVRSLEAKQRTEESELTAKWLDTEENKKIKNLQETADKDLAIARKTITNKEVLAKVEFRITDELEKAKAKIKQEEAEKAAEKQSKIAEKQLKDELFILSQEEKATKTKYDNLEFAARKNQKQLVAIQKERADEELRILKEKLKLEERAEELKLKQDYKDEAEQKAKLKQLNDSYRSRETEAEQKAADTKVKIEEAAYEKRTKNRAALSSAFGAFLKGDMDGFLNSVQQMNTAEQKSWQKQLQKGAEYAQMGAQMAQQAISFLNDLAQKKAENAIKIVQREYEAKKAILEKELSENAAAIAAATENEKQIKADGADKVKQIKEESSKKIKDLEDAYREMNSVDSKKALDEQLAAYKENAEEQSKTAKDTAATKIANAQKVKQESIDAANEEKNTVIDAAKTVEKEKIRAADAARDAEIASIRLRVDVDRAAKDAMILAANDKFTKEKDLAEQEYNVKKEAAEKEAKRKAELAKESFETSKTFAEAERDATLDAIDAIKDGDETKAKEILARAKESTKEQIRLEKDKADKAIAEAQKENDKKLDIEAKQKATLIQEKKDLEAKMHAENVAAKQKEYDLKLKAWNAQKKADIASALISGALAVIKALSMGFPVGLVMAALSGVMTGIQIGKIRNQAPPEAPTFEMGGSLYPKKGVGGLPEGRRHGAKPGEDGLMIVETQTGKVRGEMEGKEWIVGVDQSEANMPLLQAMHEKSKRGDKTPVIDFDKYRLGAMRESGVLPRLSRPMYLYGGRFRMFEDGGSVADTGGGGGDVVEGTGQAQAGFAEAQKATKEHTELLSKILEENSGMRKDMNELMSKVANNTADTASAARATVSAIRSQDFNGLVNKLGSFK